MVDALVEATRDNVTSADAVAVGDALLALSEVVGTVLVIASNGERHNVERLLATVGDVVEMVCERNLGQFNMLFGDLPAGRVN